MRHRSKSESFEAPSLVPLADMLTNTVGIMMFILAFTVLTAGSAGITQTLPIEQETMKSYIVFVCHNNRVLLLDLNQLESQVQSKIGKPNADPAWGRSLEKISLETNGFGVRGEAELYGGEVLSKGTLHLTALPGNGEDASKIAAESSAFRKTLKTASAKGQFAFFLVYPDSIGVFGKAKELAKAAKFDIGWYPEGMDDKLSDVIWSTNENEKGLDKRPQGL